MNILAKNEYTGEAVTYKPIEIRTINMPNSLKVFIIFFLLIIFVFAFYMSCKIYRKSRIERSKIQFEIEKTPESSLKSKIGNIKNISLNIIKKKYNTLSEDNKGLNEE